MKHVELDRHFLRVKKDEEVDVSLGRSWGKKYGGYLDWEDILKLPRVIILAEAGAGKSEEFRNRKKILEEEGKCAFCVSIEELADEGFEDSLDMAARELFTKWKSGAEDGWFFLDSVDEARLNHKRLDSALRKLGNVLHGNLDRTRVFISCRVSDWRGSSDMMQFEEQLPLQAKVAPLEKIDLDRVLLEPIFKDIDDTRTKKKDEATTPEKLMIVRIAPLDNEQQKILAVECGVKNVQEFHSILLRNGLERFTERPRDLIELAEYWNEHARFGTLSEMTEYSVQLKLAEIDPYRRDNSDVTKEKALLGAQKIAGALTLCHTFTIRSPGQESDPELDASAIDPDKLFLDWTESEKNALLRRPIFSPATYGRIRFHHRSTQEYLCAQWLDRLLSEGCRQSVIHQLLFVNKYGVATTIASMRAVAAWLSIRHENIRAALMTRDPMSLLNGGDPASLPIDIRKKLLRVFAEKYEAGEISDGVLEDRTLWMFSHRDLADEIKLIWNRSLNVGLRGILIRIIREGMIGRCSQILSSTLFDKSVSDYQRINALEALIECKKHTQIKKFVKTLIKDMKVTNARLASLFAEQLYPTYLTVEELLKLITHARPPGKRSIDGFGYSLQGLCRAGSEKQQIQFIEGVTALAFKKPYKADYQRVSEKYRFLIRGFPKIAVNQLQVLSAEHNPSEGLVRLLMAIERGGNSYLSSDDREELQKLIDRLPKVKRGLFMADIKEVNKHRPRPKKPKNMWEVNVGQFPLWRFKDADIQWLKIEFSDTRSSQLKQLLLSSILATLNSFGAKKSEFESLKDELRVSAKYRLIIDNFLSIPEEQQWERDERKYQEECRQNIEKKKESWRRYRNTLIKRPALITRKKEQVHHISNLTQWLRDKTTQEPYRAAQQWRLLELAFSKEVAEAYRDSMKLLWRRTKPVRPVREASGAISILWVTIYSHAGVAIEAADDPNWAFNLSDEQLKRAVSHGCFSEQEYPDWLDELSSSQPSIVLPVLQQSIRKEWKSTGIGSKDFLYHYCDKSSILTDEINNLLFDEITRIIPGSEDRFSMGVKIVGRLELLPTQKKKLRSFGNRKYKKYKSDNSIDYAITSLGYLFLHHQEETIRHIEKWIDDTEEKSRSTLVENIFGTLFNREGTGLATAYLQEVTTEDLKRLTILAYQYVDPRKDLIHEGIYSHSMRDNAEGARNVLLSTLLDRSGEDAYLATLSLSNLTAFKHSAHRLRQLAQGLVERDSQDPKWTETDILEFENKNTSPLNTDIKLCDHIYGVLSDVQEQITNGDFSSVKALRHSLREERDEEILQLWTAEQLLLRSNGKYTVHRETEVADRKEPDIVITSTSSNSEVAIEIKQANPLSVNELSHALTDQLAEKYLKPVHRRSGILLLCNQSEERWNDPVKKKRIEFDEVLNILKDVAVSTKHNSAGEIYVRIFGLNIIH